MTSQREIFRINNELKDNEIVISIGKRKIKKFIFPKKVEFVEKGIFSYFKMSDGKRIGLVDLVVGKTQ